MVASALLLASVLVQGVAVAYAAADRASFRRRLGFAGHATGASLVLVATSALAVVSLTNGARDAASVASAAVILLLSASLLVGMVSWIRSAHRRRAESENAFALTAYYRGLFEQGDWVMLIVDDTSGRVVDANACASVYYGYPRQHLVGMNVREIIPAPVEARGCPGADYEGRCIRERHRKANGEVRDVEVTASAIEIDARPLHILLVHDITDAVAASLELDRERRLLEARIAERTRELADAVSRLEAAAASKDRFLANVSHELRTPLNSIIGYTGVVLAGMAGDLTDEQRRQLRMVQRSSRHLLSLVSDLLDVAQLERGEITLVAEPFELGDLVSEVAEIMSLTVREKGLTLDVLLPSGGIEMVSDRVKIEQVLLNIVGNAVKFTDQGGITITADHRPDGTVAVVVADTGVGMPEHAIAVVTEAFEQLPRSDGMKPAGIGLGLAISRRLAEALGGGLSVACLPRCGTAFTMVVPRVHRASSA